MSQSIRHPSQRVAYSYFLASAILFVLQVVFGLIIAAQYVWPTFLMNSFAFNIGRETHLNLLIFWLLLGLMGASYYLVPDETESELYSPRLAHAQLGIMLFAGVGTLLSFWFLQASRGKPFTEAPMPWPWLIALGVVLFLVNVGVTILRAPRKTAITTVLFFGMAGMALLYLINMMAIRNLTIDYFWWWWIIHLWVEGTWELIAASITAYLLIQVTGIHAGRIARWLYVEVALTLFTGIIGIGHHYYWIGTPGYWLLWGGIFTSLQPVPIALMTYDALHSMRRRRIQPTNMVAWYFLGGSALAHFFGAGVWGVAQALPQINRWTHGTQVTSSHGHFAFFGAFGMLVLAAAYYLVPRMRGMDHLEETRGRWSFALMSVGMIFMVLAFTIAGIVQVYMNRIAGIDFMVVRTQFTSFWLFWVFLFGLVFFTPGALLYLWDFLSMRPALLPVAQLEEVRR